MSTAATAPTAGHSVMAQAKNRQATFFDKVQQRSWGIVTYGMTPPKASTEAAKLPELAATQQERLKSLNIDAVVIYDIHDEAERTAAMAPRPFPFAETLDGFTYARDYLGDVGVPYVHFRCIAKYTKSQFASYCEQQAAASSTGSSTASPVVTSSPTSAVFVGAAASTQQLDFTMQDAYAMRQALCPTLPLGGVAIAERHQAKGTEHLRMVQKQTEGGCSYFITQCVYNLEEAKNLLSDYYYHCRRQGLAMVPILVTLTPCGSKKSLEFLEWLGVKVSKWITNDLLLTTREGGILEESVEALVHMFRDLALFAAAKGIPLGCNVESVAIRRAEIEASMALVATVQQILAEVAMMPRPARSPTTIGVPAVPYPYPMPSVSAAAA